MALASDPRETYYPAKVRECCAHYAGSDPSATELYLNIHYTQDVLQQACAPYLGAFGLSKSSINILMLLRHGPEEGMQLHDLGKLLLVSRANITGVVDHLEERGYVKRVVDPQDRRARFARITPQGRSLLEEFMPLHSRNVKTMLQDLTHEEKETLIGLLQKTRASIASHAESIDQYQMSTAGSTAREN